MNLKPLLPAVLIIGLAVFCYQSRFFTVKKISCSLAGHPCSLFFEPALVSFYGQNIFSLRTDQVSQQLLQLDPTLTDIQVSKKLPQYLIIVISHRQAIAQLIQASQLQFTASVSSQLTNQYFLLDRSGEIFKQQDQSSPQMTEIIVSPELPLSLGKNSLTTAAADLVNALSDHYVAYQTIAWLADDLAVIKTSLGPYALVNPSQALISQVASLQYLLTNFKIEESLPAKIDLRFDKPVLTY